MLNLTLYFKYKYTNMQFAFTLLIVFLCLLDQNLYLISIVDTFYGNGKKYSKAVVLMQISILTNVNI